MQRWNIPRWLRWGDLYTILFLQLFLHKFQLSNSLKITEMNLAKLDVRNGKEIEYLTAKKQEVEGNLMKNLTEKNKLQRELVGNFMFLILILVS